MIRRRERPDGLPYRVYERRGVRDYSIGYKRPDGTWAFRLKCPIDDRAKIAELRQEAIAKAAQLSNGAPTEGSVSALIDAWFKRQEALPEGAPTKRAATTTIAENKREAETLRKAFGHMHVTALEKSDAYAYLDACLLARDKKGNPRPRGQKGNKEIALMRLILEYGIRVGTLKSNPFDGVEKLEGEQRDHLVDEGELALAVEVGRRMGGPQHIVALACKTAFLCLRRSFEVRKMTRDQVTEAGIEWVDGKRQHGQARRVALIEWSPELRATVDEALAMKRNTLAGSWYVFGNLSGQRYTKGGWKATLSRLMRECVVEAARRKMAFRPFSLQDCRPMGVTEKLARGDQDTQDATLHTSERMLRQVYDRRRKKVAKPAG